MTLLRAFYILTCVSLAASTAVFVLSMLRLGFDSLQINPTVAGLTIVYHVVILILQRREYNEDIPPQYRDYPASRIASLVFAYLLAFLWPVPLGIVLIHRSSVTKAQAALDAVEFVVVLAIAIVCTRMKVAADRWERNHRPAGPEHLPDRRAARAIARLLVAFQRLTYLSLAVSTVVLVLSALNKGITSAWTNLAVATMTIVYHTVILILLRDSKKRNATTLQSVTSHHGSYPTTKVASLVFVYIVACVWAIPAPFIIILGGLWGGNSIQENTNLYAANPRTVRAEVAFDLVELWIMWAIAAVSTRMRVISDQSARDQQPPKQLVPPNTQATRDMFFLLRAVYILSYVSTVGSVLVFILSFLDYGIASLWTNIVMPTFTIVYHIVILVLQASDSCSRDDPSTPQPGMYPTATVGSLVVAYLLACAWIAPALIVGLTGPPSDRPISEPTFNSRKGLTVLVQLIFGIVVCLVVFAIAAVSTRIRVLLYTWEMNQTVRVELSEGA